MTEPGIGSDLAGMKTRAKRDGDCYVVDGAKTFITNGINADLVITAVRTEPDEPHRGLSLLVIERGTEGFERGRNLEKIGQHSQDTAELFFDGCRVPAENLLGEENEGFRYLVFNLPQERLSIAAACRGLCRGGAGVDAGVRQGAPGFRAARRHLPEQPLRPGRRQDRAARGAHVRRPLRARPTSPAS